MAAPDAASLHAVAREVATLLGRDPKPRPDGLLTACQVAARFNVTRDWVYAHAEELGVIRLGDGPRPRLRFDPTIVSRLLVARPVHTPPRRLSASRVPSAPLLPITPSPPRRTLDG